MRACRARIDRRLSPYRNGPEHQETGVPPGTFLKPPVLQGVFIPKARDGSKDINVLGSSNGSPEVLGNGPAHYVRNLEPFEDVGYEV